MVLAAKGGIDVTGLRAHHPRRAELPFDSATKFMITAHPMVTVDGRDVVHVFVKGAPDDGPRTGPVAVLALAPGPEPAVGTATVAATMAFNTFVLLQFFNLLNSRSETRTVFHHDTLTNCWLWGSLTGVILLQITVTHAGPLQRLFDTTSITAANWAVCVLVASSVLWIEEARKLIHRTRHPHHQETNP